MQNILALLKFAATGVAHNLVCAQRALLQRHPNGNFFDASVGQLFILCALVWGFSALDDLAAARFSGRFSIWGIVSDAALNYLWLMALAVIVMLLNNTRIFLPLAVGSAAISVVIWIVWLPLSYVWRDQFPNAFYAYFTYLWWFVFALEIAALFRVLAWYSFISRPQRAALTLIYAGIIYLSIWYFPPQPLFNEYRTGNYAAAEIDVEQIYYAQHNLLENALFDIAPENPGQVDIYSIGFAAYGAQDVFMHEVQGALTVINEKYANGKRSLAMVNNPSTVSSVPLASNHNLARAIRELSRKMNLDEDILLLFLTSHGDEHGSISVSLANLALNDLTAEELRNMLDDAEVYWRVVIVSACYSGSFIEALKSPTTMIITAAAADKASFGCDHTRDWTYFGEAFFDQALPTHATLVESFEAAKEAVIKKELSENKESSEPQIWLGEAIKAYLTLHAL